MRGQAFDMTHEEQRDLLLSDIAAIRTADALKTWGRRWADDIKESPHRAEIKKAYVERLEELRSCSQLAIKTSIP